MRILVTLLGAGIHPKLSSATAYACAAEMMLEADALEAAVALGRQTGAKVKVLSRVRTALSRTTQRLTSPVDWPRLTSFIIRNPRYRVTFGWPFGEFGLTCGKYQTERP